MSNIEELLPHLCEDDIDEWEESDINAQAYFLVPPVDKRVSGRIADHADLLAVLGAKGASEAERDHPTDENGNT